MHRLGTNKEGKSKEQSAKPGSPEKWSSSTSDSLVINGAL